MRSGRVVSSLALAFFFLFHSVLPAALGSQKKNDPSILWAFGAIRASSSPPKLEPVTTGMVLSSGDKLKMMIRIKKRCFVYLIHRDSQGNFPCFFRTASSSLIQTTGLTVITMRQKEKPGFSSTTGPAVRPSPYRLGPASSRCRIYIRKVCIIG